jgi:hypothetical protein
MWRRSPGMPFNSSERHAGETLPPERWNEAAPPRAIYAHLGLDGVSEGIAVGVLAHEARVDDVRGFCGESRDAARRADRCSPDVGVIALAHARHHPRRSIDLPRRRANAPHRRTVAPIFAGTSARSGGASLQIGRERPSRVEVASNEGLKPERPVCALALASTAAVERFTTRPWAGVPGHVRRLRRSALLRRSCAVVAVL